jgi:hypothetical protein
MATLTRGAQEASMCTRLNSTNPGGHRSMKASFVAALLVGYWVSQACAQDPQSTIDYLIQRELQLDQQRRANEAMRLELERHDLERQLQLQRVEQAEQQRWAAEDLAIQQKVQRYQQQHPRDPDCVGRTDLPLKCYGRDPGRPRTPEETGLSQEMQRQFNQRKYEVSNALRRYCPSGAPPCSPDPPNYLLRIASQLGLIQFEGAPPTPAQPKTRCAGVADPEGPVIIDCN